MYKNWYICGYELPTNLQNFTQKTATLKFIDYNVAMTFILIIIIINRSENIPKSFRGATFLQHPVCIEW